MSTEGVNKTREVWQPARWLEKLWLDDEIYGVSGASNSIPQIEITARKRYSFRAHCIE